MNKIDRLIKLSVRCADLVEFKDDREYRPGLGTAGGIIAPIAAQTAVGGGLMAAIRSGKDRVDPHAADKPVMDYLHKAAKEAGGDVHESITESAPGVAWKRMKGEGYWARSQRAQVSAITGAKGGEQGVAIHPGVRKELKPGILAHEIGHLQQRKWLTSVPTRLGGMLGPLAGTAYAASTKDERRAQVGAAAGTLAGVPMLIGETDASLRGRRLLKGAGVKGRRLLSPGIGLASYGALAAMPGIAYGTKKLLGGYDNRKKELSSRLDSIINFDVDPSKQRPKENVARGVGMGFLGGAVGLGGGIPGAVGGAFAGRKFEKANQVYLKRDAFGHAVVGGLSGTVARAGLTAALIGTKGGRKFTKALGPGATRAGILGAGIGTGLGAQQLAAGHTLKKRLRGD